MKAISVRSSRPIPGNPWPRELALTTGSPENLLDLLWIRQARDLQPSDDEKRALFARLRGPS